MKIKNRKININSYLPSQKRNSKAIVLQGQLKKSILILILCFANMGIGCRKFVEIDPPPTKPDASVIYGNDATATAVLTGLYSSLVNVEPSFSIIPGLSSDEFTAYSTSGTQNLQAYTNSLTSATFPGVPFWANLYTNVYITNSAIEGLTNSTTLSAPVKQQLLGEAKFMRAFFYFYLVNFWGDVPLFTTSNYEVTSVLGRTSKADVWAQIKRDLIDAQNLLSASYVALDLKATTSERVRPNKWVATALLSRVYLYTGDYLNAEIQASAIINNTTLFSLSALPNTFLRATLGNNEAIWQLQPVNVGWNTEDARAFVLTTAPNLSQPTAISATLLNAFEAGDLRKTNWINSVTVGITTYYFPYKYKVATQNQTLTEYSMVFRLGEQYLIRAEASASGGTRGLSGAIADLNTIRSRANLSPTAATTQASLITAILHERQVELFSEWGHRWFDLKRTNQVDAVMSVNAPQKGVSWNPNFQLYPIPIGDILKNQNLVQNPGY